MFNLLNIYVDGIDIFYACTYYLPITSQNLHPLGLFFDVIARLHSS